MTKSNNTAHMNQFFQQHPNAKMLPNKTSAGFDFHGVIQWHRLGRWPTRPVGTLLGWTRRSCGAYESFEIHRAEYVVIALCEIKEPWVCDIRDIDGLSIAQANSSSAESMDKWVEREAPELISEVSLEALARNLAAREADILKHGARDHCFRCEWDRRLFLINRRGAHRFAAAKYIAGRIDARVPINAALHSYGLNEYAVRSLVEDYAIFAMTSELSVWESFCEAMRAFDATWLWHPMPEPYYSANAILLPRSEARSIQVATMLQEAEFFDLGKHLRRMLDESE